MPRPVSIVVWRDAKTDPPTKDGGYLVKDGDYPTVCWGYDTESGKWFFHDEVHRIVLDPPVLWAEWPVVSDLTDDDVRDAAQQVEHAALGVRNNVAARLRAALADRLRAALGGEKEGT